MTLVNDVRALTLAELRLGAGRGAADLVCIALGTGVGGGVVIGGRLHLGLGHAGEIGHTTVDPDGPLCGCGNRGCLDRMASAQSIAAAAGRADVAEAAAAARAGDRVALAAFARAGEYVGRVLAGRGRAAVARARGGRRRRGRRRTRCCSTRCAPSCAAAPASRPRSPSCPPSSARSRAPSGRRCGAPRSAAPRDHRPAAAGCLKAPMSMAPIGHIGQK